MTDPEVNDHKDGDLNVKSPSSPEEAVSGPSLEGAEVSSGPASSAPGEDTPSQAKAGASSPLALEKRVRFSEELIQGVGARPSTGAQNSARLDTRGPSPLKASSPSKIKHEVQRPKQAPESVQDGGVPDQGDPPAPAAQPQSSSEHRALPQQQTSEAPIVSETESSIKDSVPPAVPNSPPTGKACTSLQENSVQPVEHPKSNISNRNTGVPQRHSFGPHYHNRVIGVACL